jgi:hypothetical protein
LISPNQSDVQGQILTLDIWLVHRQTSINQGW